MAGFSATPRLALFQAPLGLGEEGSHSEKSWMVRERDVVFSGERAEGSEVAGTHEQTAWWSCKVPVLDKAGPDCSRAAGRPLQAPVGVRVLNDSYGWLPRGNGGGALLLHQGPL